MASPGFRGRSNVSFLARLAIGAALVASFAFLAPRGVSAGQHPARPAPFINSGTLTFVTDQVPSDIDPANDEVAGSDVVARTVEEPLVAPLGSSLSKFEPVLATHWTSNKNMSVWTFYLRHGVRFHTGRCCLNAADVKYNVERVELAGLTNAFGFQRYMSNPRKQIKILNNYTVQFDLGRPQPTFINQMSSLYMSTILDSHALKAHAVKGDWGHGYASSHDLGTGPYMIQSWQHSQQVTMVRFPQYWGGWSGRHFSKIIMQTVLEASTRRELMEKGQADITFHLTPQDNLALEHNPHVKVVAPYGTEVEYIYMTEYGPLASTAARQAMSYAFDYNAMINGVLKGFARRAYGCLPRTMLGYDPNQFHYQTDLAKARQLLKKAGIKAGMTLTYYYTEPYQQDGLILQAQLAQLGITVKITHLDEAAYESILYSKQPLNKRPNFMAWGWWPDFNDPYDECNILLNSASAPPVGANSGFYHNATVDRALNAMKYATGKHLIQLSYKMQEAQALDPSAIWVDEPAQVTILAKNLQGYIFNPVELQTYDFYHLYRS